MGKKTLLGQRVMKHARANHLIAPSQYATKNNKAVVAATVKRLYNDLLRITKKTRSYYIQRCTGMLR